MKVTDIIARAGRNLRRAKMRTLLTSVAIAVGGFAIMVSLMAGEGARQYVDRVISANMDPRTVMIGKDDSAFSVTGATTDSLKEYDPDKVDIYGVDIKVLTVDDIEKLRSRDDVQDLEPYSMLNTKYVEFSTKPDKKYITRVDTRHSSLAVPTVAGMEIKSGTVIERGQIVLPDEHLEKIGIASAEDAIGKTIAITVEQQVQPSSEDELMQAYMTGGEAAVKELTKTQEMKKEFQIVSVSEKTAEQAAGGGAPLLVGQADFEEMVDFNTLGTDAYHKYIIAYAIVADGHEPQDVKEAIESAGYGAMTAKDMQELIFTFVNLLQGIVIGFGVLALVVSLFGIVNTMYISVLERTQQIGLMKALGASKRDIGRLFRYEAAWVGALGGVLGVVFALIGGLIFNPIISDKLSLGEHHLLIFQPHMAALVVAVLILVAIIAGWLPSNRAAKLDPIEALRTE